MLEADDTRCYALGMTPQDRIDRYLRAYEDANGKPFAGKIVHDCGTYIMTGGYHLTERHLDRMILTLQGVARMK